MIVIIGFAILGGGSRYVWHRVLVSQSRPETSKVVESEENEKGAAVSGRISQNETKTKTRFDDVTRPTTREILREATGDALFSILFSKEFLEEKNWRRFQVELRDRLLRKLDQTDQESFAREQIAKLGVLKALSRVEISQQSKQELVTLLREVIEGEANWLVQREAMHALLRSDISLGEKERVDLIGRLDSRARMLASYIDRELIERVIESVAGERAPK